MVMSVVGHSLFIAMFLLLVCLNITNGSFVVCSPDNLSNHLYLFPLNNSSISNCSVVDSPGWNTNNTSSEVLPDGKGIDKWVTGPGLPPPGWVSDANLPNMSDNSTKII